MTNDEPITEPPGRGGGPPGGSAFTRDGKVRQPIRTRLTPNTAAFTDAAAAPAAPADSARRQVAPAVERSFPGGRVKLPQISGTQGRSLFVSGVAFRPSQSPDTTPGVGPTRSGFSEYYSIDSLFDQPEDSAGVETRPDVPAEVLHACAELRVDPETPWSEVVARHRALVKEFHPDSFNDHDNATRDLAETEIRRINQAYDVLRRRPHRRPDDPPDRSSRPPSDP